MRIVAKLVIQLAVITAKLIAVPFGVPFDHSYHDDFKFDTYLKVDRTNRPPKVFGKEGFNLAGTGNVWSIQCAKCGIHADFSIDGRLAFSIKDGITQGKVSLVNRDPFMLDAQFGIKIEKQQQKTIEEKWTKQLSSVPLSPFAIPGIITLGPQATISVSLDLALNGQVELLIGGSLSISPGTATLSLVNKTENNLEGLVVTFTPVAQVRYSLFL